MNVNLVERTFNPESLNDMFTVMLPATICPTIPEKTIVLGDGVVVNLPQIDGIPDIELHPVFGKILYEIEDDDLNDYVESQARNIRDSINESQRLNHKKNTEDEKEKRILEMIGRENAGLELFKEEYVSTLNTRKCQEIIKGLDILIEGME
jgi:hypothetical protein